MNPSLESQLEELRADFETVCGRSFDYFYCPILHRDEPAELCTAHLVNRAIPGASRITTIQRKDVDNFFGSRFESDFVDIAHFGSISALQVLCDKGMSRRFDVNMYLDGQPVEHIFHKGDLPEGFTSVRLTDVDNGSAFGLRMHREDVLASRASKWEVEVSRDIRLPMLVSLVKAAHLSLFHILGYRYAFSASGYFVGKVILGSFVDHHRGTPKRAISDAAIEFFSPWVHMARPITTNPTGLQGTATDQVFYSCIGASGVPWAFIVFVNLGQSLHAVMIPTLQDLERVEAFFGFLHNSNTSIRVSAGRFLGDRFELSRDTVPIIWPKDGALLT